jgi:deazaflavin-dependent oxidoreductase (nitroreductase family)
MAAPIKTLARTIAVIAGIVIGLAGSLYLILRYQPRPLVAATRKLFGRVLNPAFLQIADRFNLETWQHTLYHTGRKTGREYRTPLCVAPTPEGFIVPAAFGPDVDWLANLRANPRARITFEGTTHPVVAEVIDRKEAFRLGGGSAGCPCWDQFRIQHYAILRPEPQDVADAGRSG